MRIPRKLLSEKLIFQIFAVAFSVIVNNLLTAIFLRKNL